jgi:ABC-type uncharacterized transport system substrate-binding protein
MTFFQIVSGIAILIAALVGAAWGIPQAILLWKQMFDRIRADQERKRIAEKSICGRKDIVRIGVILNGDLEYAANLFRGFREETERLLEATPYEPHFFVGEGSPREDEDHINATTLHTVVNAFGSYGPRYLVTFGTRVSQYAVKHAGDELGIIFVGVTDPVGSGILTQRPRRNIAGTTYGLGIRERLTFLTRVFPNAKRIGYVYNRAFPQDLIVRDKFKEAVSSLPGYPDNFPMFDTFEVELIRDVADVNILVGWSYLNSKMDTYLTQGFPVAGISIAECRYGAVASTGNDDVKLGKLAAEKVLFQSLVKGSALKEIPLIETADDHIAPRLFAVNLSAAYRHGLTVLERAELEKIARVFE